MFVISEITDSSEHNETSIEASENRTESKSASVASKDDSLLPRNAMLARYML